MRNKTYYINYIINGSIETVLKELLVDSKDINPFLYDNIMLQYSKWNRLKQKEIDGTILFEEFSIEENKIYNILLRIITYEINK